MAIQFKLSALIYILTRNFQTTDTRNSMNMVPMTWLFIVKSTKHVPDSR